MGLGQGLPAAPLSLLYLPVGATKWATGEEAGCEEAGGPYSSGSPELLVPVDPYGRGDLCEDRGGARPLVLVAAQDAAAGQPWPRIPGSTDTAGHPAAVDGA